MERKRIPTRDSPRPDRQGSRESLLATGLLRFVYSPPPTLSPTRPYLHYEDPTRDKRVSPRLFTLLETIYSAPDRGVGGDS